MTQQPMKQYKNLSVAFFILALSIILGAFAAHGLEAQLAEKYIKTFKTGVYYHQLHALGLIFLSLIEKNFNLKTTWERLLIYLGILLFSGNCYIYAITQIKIFALIVPLGGISFILAWSILSYRFFKKAKTQ